MKTPVLAVLYLALIFLFAISQSCAAGRPAVKQLEFEITKKLPLGSSDVDVIQFLEENNITHSDLTPAHLSNGHLMPDSDLAKYSRQDEVERYISAIIRNVGSEWLMTSNITLKFWFDKDNHLIGYGVWQTSTGL